MRVADPTTRPFGTKKAVPALALGCAVLLTACGGGAPEEPPAQDSTIEGITPVPDEPTPEKEVEAEEESDDLSGLVIEGTYKSGGTPRPGAVFMVPAGSVPEEHLIGGETLFVNETAIWSALGDACGGYETSQWVSSWFESRQGESFELTLLGEMTVATGAWGQIEGLAEEMVAAGYAVPRAPGQTKNDLSQPTITEEDPELEALYEQAKAEGAGIHAWCDVDRASESHAISTDGNETIPGIGTFG